MRTLAVVALLLAAATAHADDRGPGVVCGAALGTGSFVLNGELSLGARLSSTFSVLARAAGHASERDSASEIGVALHLRAPGDLDHFFIEPQASYLRIDPEFDCGLTADSCVGGKATGFSAGAAVGAQLTRSDTVSLDLRLTVAVAHYRDFGSHQLQNPVLTVFAVAVSFY